MVDQEARKGPR